MAKGQQKIVEAVRTPVKVLFHPQAEARMELIHMSPHTRYARRGLFGERYLIAVTYKFPNGKEISDGLLRYESHESSLHKAEEKLREYAVEYGFIDG